MAPQKGIEPLAEEPESSMLSITPLGRKNKNHLYKSPRRAQVKLLIPYKKIKINLNP